MTWQLVVFQPIIMNNTIQMHQLFGLEALLKHKFHYIRLILATSTELITWIPLLTVIQANNYWV